MTGNTTRDEFGFEALEHALDCYGSDRTRWPAPVRRNLATLIAGDPAAQRRLAEAEALDRLLDKLPEPQLDTRALADRILAAASVEAPAAVPVARVAWAEKRRPRMPRIDADAPWAAAAVLAASLFLGAFVGLSGSINPAFQTADYEASEEVAMDAGQLAFYSDAFGLFEEDTL